MHLFSYIIFILINGPGSLQFKAHKNDVLEQNMWTNILKFECPKPDVGVILTTFPKIMNKWEGTFI